MMTLVTVANAGLAQTAEKSFLDFVEEWLAVLAAGNKDEQAKKAEKAIDVKNTGKRAKKTKTILSYRYSLQTFKKWLDAQNISMPTLQDVKDWRAALESQELSLSTKNLLIAGVRAFYKWLSNEHGLDNLAAGIEGWQVSKEHKRGFLTLPEMKTLLKVIDTADLSGKRKKLTKRDEQMIKLRRLRDKAIIAVMMGGGLRTIEVCRLRVCDLYHNAGTNYLYVWGKGKDDRVEVKISAKVADTIRAWSLAREDVDIVSDESPLFCSIAYRSFGDALTTHTISTLTKFYLELAELKNKAEVNSKNEVKVKPIVAHSLRASMATNSYLKGATLDQVKQQLRHENLATTLIYIREAEKSLNPCTDIISAAIF